MTDTLISVIGLLLCGVLLSAVLRPQRPEIAVCLTLAVGAAVAVLLLRTLLPLMETVRRMLPGEGFPSEYLTVVLKAAGITVLAQMTADTCRDAGETALAAKAELAGRVLLLVLSVPLFEKILELVTGLIGGQAVGG